jgi:hypothetical protein
MRVPPEPPRQSTGRPAPSSTKVGVMLETGLRPARATFTSAPFHDTLPACAGSLVKSSSSLLMKKPPTLRRMPKGQLTVVVTLATLPSASTTHRCEVPRPGVAAPDGPCPPSRGRS